MLIQTEPAFVGSTPFVRAPKLTESNTRTARTVRAATVKVPFAPSPAVPACSWYGPVKIMGEYAAAAMLMVIAAPLMAIAALLVKLTSRGPAFYTQKRVGKDGQLFTIVKIRTMIHECESLTGPRWSMPGDPRITAVGRILRKSHLDELPQLINVLRGEMALVGPRPERPEFVPRLERVLPQYRERLLIRPGITGLAQVHFGADTDIESVRRKLAYDRYYLARLSPILDLRIVMATVFYALGNPFDLKRTIAAVPIAEIDDYRAELKLADAEYEGGSVHRLCA